MAKKNSRQTQTKQQLTQDNLVKKTKIKYSTFTKLRSKLLPGTVSLSSQWGFRSKMFGLNILNKSIKSTGAAVLSYKVVNPGKNFKKTFYDQGYAILVRSDQLDIHQVVSRVARSKQPRQQFPNTLEGRNCAENFAKAHLGQYGLFVQHLKEPRENVILHGRIFINPKGRVWIYIASPDIHNTFARWHHRICARYDLSGPSGMIVYNNDLTLGGFIACLQVSRNIAEYSQKIGLQEMARAAFVVYKDKPDIPEFYDLLFIQGMKRPSSRIF